MPTSQSAVVPCLFYHDGPAAIAWLRQAFGFEPKLVVPGENGAVAHAELVLGGIMIMLGSNKDSAFGRNTVAPRDINGMNTQSPYLIVADPAALYRRAKDAGAEIVTDLKTEPYGGSQFSCRDPEGHLWTFGSYDPWAAG